MHGLLWGIFAAKNFVRELVFISRRKMCYALKCKSLKLKKVLGKPGFWFGQQFETSDAKYWSIVDLNELNRQLTGRVKPKFIRHQIKNVFF